MNVLRSIFVVNFVERLGTRRLLFIGIAAAVALGLVANCTFNGTSVEKSTADSGTALANKTYLPQMVRGYELPATDTPTPTVTPIATQTPPATATSTPTATPTFGNSPQMGIWGSVLNANSVQQMKNAGARWTRFTINWSSVEPVYTEPATYNFTTYDSFMLLLIQAGITPIVEIRGNPSWAATTICGPIDIRPNAFGRFMAALASHYGQAPFNVKNFEFYNEPDNTDSVGYPWLGGCWGNNAGSYATMLQAASSAVKSVIPDAKIIFGGMAFESVPTIFNPSFLDQVLAAGGGSYFDVANVHYYSSQNPTWQSNGYDIAGKVGAVRKVMAAHGVSKPVVVTESSWTSSLPTAPDLAEKQAQYVPKVFVRSSAIDLYAVIWFALSDMPYFDYPYGLMDVNFNPKPSFVAFQVAAAELADARYIRKLSSNEVGSQGAVEGYVFATPQGETRWVLWAEGSQTQVFIPTNALLARNKLGGAITLSSGAPSSILLDNSPIYVHFGSFN